MYQSVSRQDIMLASENASCRLHSGILRSRKASPRTATLGFFRRERDVSTAWLSTKRPRGEKQAKRNFLIPCRRGSSRAGGMVKGVRFERQGCIRLSNGISSPHKRLNAGCIPAAQAAGRRRSPGLVEFSRAPTESGPSFRWALKPTLNSSIAAICLWEKDT